MSVQQNADGSYSVYDAGGNVVISSTDADTASKMDAQYGGSGTPSSGGTSPDQIAGGDRTPIAEKRARLIQASGDPNGKWATASDAEVNAEYDRLQRAAGRGGGGGGGGDAGYNPGAANIGLQLAQAAAQQAYLNERLRQVDIPAMQNLDARERERLALEKARDAFNQAFQRGQLSGYVEPQAGQGIADRAQAAWDATPAEQRGPQTAANIWKQQIPGLSDAEAQRMAQVGQQYYLTNKTSLPNDVAQQYLSQITGGRISGQTPSLQRETNQNQTMINLLDLQSRLRGPGDWVQYMQTVQSTPPELRNVINQAAGRFQMPGAQPGAASVGGLIGDLNRGPGGYAAGGVYGGQPMPPQQGGEPMATQPSTRFQGPGFAPAVPVQGWGPNAIQQGTGQGGGGLTALPMAGAGSADDFRRMTPGAGGVVGPGGGATMRYAQQAGPATGQAGPDQFGMNIGPGTGAAYRTQAGPATGAAGPTPMGSVYSDNLTAEQQAALRARTSATAMPYQTGPQPGAWDPFQRQTPQTGLPLANQLPRSFATASPDVQDMILSPYEAAGQSKRQVVYDFEKSLPQYGGPTRGVRRY